MQSGGYVPFVIRNNKLVWKVSLDEVTLLDLFKIEEWNGSVPYDSTVNVNISGSIIGISETVDLSAELYFFKKFYKAKQREWRPYERRIKLKSVIKYMSENHILPEDLFSAIWMKHIYQIQEVMYLFGVNRTDADNILRASGYIKKTESSNYILNQDRKKSVILCFEKAESAASELKDRMKLKYRFRQWICRMIRSYGTGVLDLSDRLSYYDLCTADWEEPVYGKKKEYFKSIVFCIIIAFVIILCILIINFSAKAEQGNSSELSTLFSAIIAGIISVLTTYAIMHQTYKIDYHQERLAAMPVFKAEIIPTEDLKVAENDDYKAYIDGICNALNIDRVEDQSQGEAGGYILKIENYGKGVAFHVNIGGIWAPYDDVRMASFNIGQVKYILIQRAENIFLKCNYYDLYGNYYIQNLEGAKDYCGILYKEMEADPPELELRTKRIRYCQ
jgi:hypothetical protein